MSTWYTVKVKFTKEFQDGTLKRVTEPYLVNAGSFTEAEARIYEEVGEFIRGEFIVTSIARTDFADIFHYDDSDRWYKCKVNYTTEDDNGKEKKVSNNFMCSAPTAKDAYERMEDSLKGMMSVFEIPAINLTSIVEILPALAGEGEDGEKKSKGKSKAKNAAKIQVAVKSKRK
ncbi:MAG: DUF4494 domain-containing protein [Crocinitomicaceae bacterium]|nr:DUF4494 domain-containing protein [Crocinitomicaceae bacterium]